MKSSVYLEFQEKQILQDSIVAQAKELWKKIGNGAALETLQLYMKPEENAVYCVFNDDIEDMINL